MNNAGEKTKDQKVYNVWAHRGFVLRLNNFLWDDMVILLSELKYTEKMLKEDMLNNSAWNHRYNCIKQWSELQLFSDSLSQETDVSSLEIAFRSYREMVG